MNDSALPRLLLGWLIVGIVMCALPFFVSSGTLRIFIFANFLAMFAMSWDILSGRTGYISFGHPFLIGIAAYTTAMLTYHLDTPLWLSIPAAVLMTMVGGTFFFVPALRIRGTYFALVTLAVMELMYQLTQVLAPNILAAPGAFPAFRRSPSARSRTTTSHSVSCSSSAWHSGCWSAPGSGPP